MTTNSIEIVSALCSFASVLVAIIGFWFVVRQMRQVERALRTDAAVNLSQQSFEILGQFVEHPEIYDCFYTNAPLPTEPNLRIRALVVAEMVANYCDHVLQQRSNMHALEFENWEVLIRESFMASDILYDFVFAH